MTLTGKIKILLIDDDEDVLELLRYNLNSRGYKVKCINNATLAVQEALSLNPNLIVLDIMMPELNGLELCQQLRNHQTLANTPVFFLTGKTENYIFSSALHSGGDDLIYKGSGIRSLIMKIASVVEEGLVIRKRMSKLKIGRWELNRKSSTVSIGEKKIQLTKDEFELFYLFAQNPTKTIEASTVRNYVWGADIFHISSSIDEFIERIEKKIKTHCFIEVKRNFFRFNLLKCF